MMQTSGQRRSSRRRVSAVLVGSLLLGCAATRLSPDPQHPASAAAESVPLPAVGGALAEDFEPAPAAASADGSAGSAHDHAAEAEDQLEGKAPGETPEKPATTWTCPMHPEIVRDQPGNCPICGMKLKPVAPKESSGDEP